jgi:hypothetical protein
MEFLKSMIFTGAVVGLAACGKSNDAKQAIENVKASPVTVQEAQYSSTCSPTPKLKAMGPLVFLSSKTVYELSELKFSKINAYYSDPSCGSESLIIKETGTTKVVSTPNAAGEPTQEDFTFTKTFIQPIGSITTKVLNEFKACGFSNNEFVVGAELDVSAQAAGEHCVGEPASRTVQEVVLVQANQLFLGANMESAQRPSKVDTTAPYSKTNP